PYIHNALLLALEQFLFPEQNIVLRGNKEMLGDWMQAVNQHYALRRFLVAIPDDESDLPGVLVNYKPQQQIVAYVCEGFECKPPITKKDDLSLLSK
ncbi:MAG: thioredoxin domain-containing protein, partial [Gammaproteobacteria bacterium]|nr:thioredoxin domain-containing protein [Gammaproteobacteria bacterium]